MCKIPLCFIQAGVFKRWRKTKSPVLAIQLGICLLEEISLTPLLCLCLSHTDAFLSCFSLSTYTLAQKHSQFGIFVFVVPCKTCFFGKKGCECTA